MRLLDRFRGNPTSAIAVVDMLTSAGTKQEMEPRLRLQVELANAVVRSTAASARSLDQWIAPAAGNVPTSSATVRAARLYQSLGVAADPSAITFAQAVAAVEGDLPSLDSVEIGTWIVTEIHLQALTLLVRSGAYAVADPLLGAARQHLRERDHQAQWKAFSILLAQSLAAQGRLMAADELLGEATMAELDHDVTRYQLLALTTSELGALHQGIAAALPASLDRDESMVGLFDSAEVAEARGRICVLSRDWQGGLDHFEKAADLSAARGIVNPALTGWRIGRCEALLGLGRMSEAIELATENLEMARQFAAPVPLAVALRTAAKVAVGDRRCALLEEALDVLVGTPAEVNRCRILIDLGVAHQRVGDASGAREVLRRERGPGGAHRVEAAGRFGSGRAARCRGEAAPPRALRFRFIDTVRASSGHAGRGRAHQLGDRRRAVRRDQDGGEPPGSGLSKARDQIPHRAPHGHRLHCRRPAPEVGFQLDAVGHLIGPVVAPLRSLLSSDVMDLGATDFIELGR